MSSAVPWRRPLAGRDPDEEHRASTPLELFFDLCFVVAVAAAAAGLHHDLAGGHLSGLVGYAIAFFAIWWAWVNYSWFASAYDSGDVRFRLATFVVMTGVLVLAAGIPAGQEHHDFRAMVVGYVIMRLALVPLWWRAAADDADRGPTDRTYALLVLLVQAAWVFRTWVLPHGPVGWTLLLVLVVAELTTPYLAERRTDGTPWHRHHVAERYELFTIIVIGEVVLATSQAISASLAGRAVSADLLVLVTGALLLVFAIWWAYFKTPLADCLRRDTAFAFGYAHYFVFSSVAAVGAGLGAAVDLVHHDTHGLPAPGVLLFIAAAVSAYLLALGCVHALGAGSPGPLGSAGLVSVVLLGAASLSGSLGVGVPLGVLLLGGLVAASMLWHTARTQPG